MTIDGLIRGICKQLQDLFSDFPLRHPVEAYDDTPRLGNGLRIYAHEKPVALSSDDDPMQDDAPYIIVRATGGTLPFDGESGNTCITAVILTWDDREDSQGDADLLQMIQMIHMHFGRRPYVGNYRLSAPINWVLSEESLYPYYLGAVTMEFEGIFATIEDPLA